MVEPKLKKCPKCGKQKLVRLIGSGNGMIFKGSGFYETDYKRKAPASPAGGPSSDAKPAPSAAPSAGGSCGSGCGCHPN